MKRLLISGFLIISLTTILAVTNTSTPQGDCSKKLCCMKKCNKTISPKTDYIFWEPIGRLMMVAR